MKTFKTLLIAGFTLMLSVGGAHAVDLDDLDVTIRVIDSDDIDDISHELSLPFPAPTAERKHAEGGLSHASDVRRDDHGGSGHEHVAKNESGDRDEGREQSEDEVEHRDESREDNDDAHEERDDAEEQERHEDEQEDEQEGHDHKDGEGMEDPLPDVPDIPGTPGDKSWGR